MFDEPATGPNRANNLNDAIFGKRAYFFTCGILLCALVPTFNFHIPTANGNLILMALAGGAFAAGAWARLFNATWFRLFVLYVFVFVVFQTYASPLVLEDRIVARDLRVLTPNYRRTSIIDSPYIEGISGQQTLVTDREGFRTTRPVNYAEKPRGTIRIFTVGGSTAEEIHLGNDNGWAAGLERRLADHLGKPVEVINTGVSGLRAAHHAATIRYTKRFSPDYYVVLLGLNDWNYHFQQGAAAGLADQMPPPGFWTPIEEAFSSFPKFHDSAIHRALSNLRRRMSGQSVAVNRWNPGHLKPVEPGTVRIERGEFYAEQVYYTARIKLKHFKIDQVSLQFLKDFRRLMKECESVRCLVVNQPTAYGPDISDRMKSKLWMTPPMVDWAAPLEDIEAARSVYNRFIISAAKRNGIAACDAASEFPRDERNFYDDAHFTQKGSKAFAKFASDCFIENFLKK